MRTIVLLLGLLISAPAMAEWVKYWEGDNGDSYYYDPSTIKRNGNLVRVWEISDLKERSKSGVLSARMLPEHDCKEDRRRQLYFSTHSGPMSQGETLYSDTTTGPWRYIPPDTVAEDLLKILCKP